MTIQFEFIYTPTSGQYSEEHFETFDRNFKSQSWNWVLFTNADGTQWAASFRGGDSDKKSIAAIKDTPFVLVISDGQGYFVNTETRRLMKFTDQNAIKEAAGNADNSLILFAETSSVFTVDKTLELRELQTPFQCHFVWFKQFLGD